MKNFIFHGLCWLLIALVILALALSLVVWYFENVFEWHQKHDEIIEDKTEDISGKDDPIRLAPDYNASAWMPA